MKLVFVVGAGPAGLYASNKLAQAGHQVVLVNRDIKPGGLAEYGIYPVKDKMKGGLRKQFAKILSQPNLHYLGHLPVARDRAVSLESLREFSPAAIVCAIGAQGTKKLGLPGEQSKGVYSAKDFVYHYNLLPPFSSGDFSTGKRVAIVGMGNVMVDIARWLLVDDPEKKTEEVVVVARRGPFEAKFDHKEFEHIEMFLDRRAFADEMARIADPLKAVGQDVAQVAEQKTFSVLSKPDTGSHGGRLKFRFLCSPQAIQPDSGGRIERLTVSENILVPKNGGTGPQATGRTAELDVDTMIFAIGDVVDPGFGLPNARGAYITNPDEADPDRAAYEVYDPEKKQVIEGTYVVGWARKASVGLVGVARHDAELGAAHVLKYLESAPEKSAPKVEEIARQLEGKGIRTVSKQDLACLARAEERQAGERGLASFKYADDATMLSVIETEKTNSGAGDLVSR